MRSCVFAGTFDPVTAGHYETVKRCLEILTRFTWGCWSIRTRPVFYRRRAVRFSEKGVCRLSRGKDARLSRPPGGFYEGNGRFRIRAGRAGRAGFCYEMENYRRSLTMDPGLFTLFVPAAGGLEAVSSTRVKRGLKQGEDVSQYLPAAVREDVIKAYRARERES